ncbi:hypothetical protein Slin15195_G126290 [Septoria linicola]|uniref:Uncharacterized protein n=1 Tax=Septoria linicola TaxID=215465 RepID=A0A9Q9EQN7_9PEZI|nr:hypothetical protein Slin14017_G082470 [Septoria linicola]USW59310.1 hypothetical protein Slin15195_G126290 [Septoria linicola]
MSRPNPLGSNPPNGGGGGLGPPWCTCGCGGSKLMVWNDQIGGYENPPAHEELDPLEQMEAIKLAREVESRIQDNLGVDFAREVSPFEIEHKTYD